MSPLVPLWEDTGLGSTHRNFSSRCFMLAPGCSASRDAKAVVGLLPTSGFFSKLGIFRHAPGRIFATQGNLSAG